VSYTANPADLTAYGPLRDERGRSFVLRWEAESVAAVAVLEGGDQRPITDRTEAARLTNTRLYIDREQLPPPAADEFYLADLVGLEALDDTGASLGRVVAVHDYGAGASLEISQPERPPLLVPFTCEAVPEIDIAAGRLTVRPPLERDFAELTAA
jgi:16S rRNA processing protein RimM